MIVSRSQTKTTKKEGSGQPTVLAFVKSLARFLAILVGDKPLIIIIHKYTFPVSQLYEYHYEFNYQVAR